MDNFYAKVIKRDDGSQVKIEAHIDLESARHKELIYKHTVFTREKGKRKWVHVPSQHNGDVNREVNSVASIHEIWGVQKALWSRIEPKFPAINYLEEK